jgi:hypothetical protein
MFISWSFKPGRKIKAANKVSAAWMELEYIQPVRAPGFPRTMLSAVMITLL